MQQLNNRHISHKDLLPNLPSDELILFFEDGLKALETRLENLLEQMDTDTRQHTRALEACFEAGMLETRLKIFELRHRSNEPRASTQAQVFALQTMRQDLIATYRTIRSYARHF